MTERFQNNNQDGLLEQVALGIESAMERCIDRYGSLVWAIAQRYVKNRSCAEDVVQETFTDLWKVANRYDPALATESTFIGMLAKRRAIDYVRRESRMPQLVPMSDFDENFQSFIDSPSGIRSDGSDVRAALQTLPEDTQTIFSLHFDKGMSHPEIVEKTGIPLGTVKTRLRRGLIDVRNQLRRLEGAKPSRSAAV